MHKINNYVVTFEEIVLQFVRKMLFLIVLSVISARVLARLDGDNQTAASVMSLAISRQETNAYVSHLYYS